MAQVELIQTMLKDCGAIQLINPNNAHPKFKLPSGDLFVMAATPSDHRSMQNALSELRRKLRPTHPEISGYGRNTPKSKVLPISEPSPRTIHTRSRVVPFHSQPLQKLQPALSAPLPSPGFRPSPTQRIEEPEYETLVYHPRQVHKKYVNQNGMAKTLTNEQLAEANRRLHLFGQAGMDAYLNECRNCMMPASLVIRDNSPQPICTEDEFMNDVLAGVRAELRATTARIETFDERKAALDREFSERKKALSLEKDTDQSKAVQLQAFVDEHEAFLARQQAVLKMLSPTSLSGKTSKAKRVGTRPPYTPRIPGAPPKGIPTELFKSTVLPWLTSNGHKTFTAQQASDAAVASGALAAPPEMTNVYPLLSGYVKKGLLERVEDNRYSVVETK